MKPVVEVGQEYEKRQERPFPKTTRIRVLEIHANRMDVATVLPDGRLVQKRSMLVSALTNTPGGYMLVNGEAKPRVSEEALTALSSLMDDEEEGFPCCGGVGGHKLDCHPEGRKVRAGDGRDEALTLEEWEARKAPQQADNPKSIGCTLCGGVGKHRVMCDAAPRPAPSPLTRASDEIERIVPFSRQAAAYNVLLALALAVREECAASLEVYGDRGMTGTGAARLLRQTKSAPAATVSAPSPLEVLTREIKRWIPEPNATGTLAALAEVEAALRPLAEYVNGIEAGGTRRTEVIHAFYGGGRDVVLRMSDLRRARDVLGGGK